MAGDGVLRCWLLAAAAMVGSCATVDDAGGGDLALPNAAAGPFRELEHDELGNNRAAPNALKNDDHLPRDPSVLDADGDLETFASVGYVAHTEPFDGLPDPAAPPNAIARYLAPDGRSFERTFEIVLEPALDWEGGVVGAPCALAVGGEVWLDYGTAGGIGLARSNDGLDFRREAEPVLGPDAVGWERGATPASPTVVRAPGGDYRMFYEVALAADYSVIGEARSEDGVRWQRTGSGPVLVPSEPGGVSSYDDASVGAPHAIYHRSVEGRMILWLYYGALDRDGRRTVAVAARTDGAEPFQRASAPVFGASSSLGPTEPWVIRYPSFTLLFATQRAGRTQSQDYPAVAAGVAPATAVLPPPVAD